MAGRPWLIIDRGALLLTLGTPFSISQTNNDIVIAVVVVVIVVVVVVRVRVVLVVAHFPSDSPTSESSTSSGMCSR